MSRLRFAAVVDCRSGIEYGTDPVRGPYWQPRYLPVTISESHGYVETLAAAYAAVAASPHDCRNPRVEVRS